MLLAAREAVSPASTRPSVRKSKKVGTPFALSTYPMHLRDEPNAEE